jgi:hypothetical protein
MSLSTDCTACQNSDIPELPVPSYECFLSSLLPHDGMTFLLPNANLRSAIRQGKPLGIEQYFTCVT